MKLYERIEKIIKLDKWYKIKYPVPNSAGVLLEKLLGIEKNNFPIPDYDNFEIKTKFHDSSCGMSLFHAVPDSYLFEIKRIYETYGYPSIIDPKNKVFLSSFYCTKITPLGMNVAAKLFIDWKAKKIVLKFYNFQTNTIDDKVSWSFDYLKNRINLKIHDLCLIDVLKKYKKNEMYCKFNEYHLYKYKNFNSFLKSLEYGHICIKFCINTFKSGNKIGKMHDHGTSFDIMTDKIDDIFIKTL